MSGEVFDHGTRKKIYNHILAYPGVSFHILRSVFGLTESTLRYHLKYMEGKNEIKSSKEGNKRCYYPVNKIINDPNTHSGIGVYKLNTTQERLLNVIRGHPGISQKDLAIKTRLKKITVGYNIKKLLNFGIIQMEKNGKSSIYYYITSEELKRKMLKKLIKKLINKEIDEHTFLIVKKKLDQ